MGWAVAGGLGVLWVLTNAAWRRDLEHYKHLYAIALEDCQRTTEIAEALVEELRRVQCAKPN